MPTLLEKEALAEELQILLIEKNIRAIIESLKVPDNMAVIVRTAGSKRTKEINEIYCAC